MWPKTAHESRHIPELCDRLTEHGYDTISSALPRLLNVLKDNWPDCRTFKGVEVYLTEALAPIRERERREEQRLPERDNRRARVTECVVSASSQARMRRAQATRRIPTCAGS